MGKNVLKLDVHGFDEYAEKLERLDADLKKIFTDALEEAGETITEDTENAVTEANLPAGGKYSSGETKEWNGTEQSGRSMSVLILENQEPEDI